MEPTSAELKSERNRVYDLTLGNLWRAWQDLAEVTRVKLTGAVRPDLPEDDRERLKDQIEDCLERRGGDVSARARAADLGRTYLGLNAEGRQRFLTLLAYDYGVDNNAVAKAIAEWKRLYQQQNNNQNNNNDYANALRQAEKSLRRALKSPRVQLLAQFNGLPEGVKFLVDLREELMPLARQDIALKGLDDDLKELLTSWFDIGFLELRSITWDAPASLLEKLAHYEAVHEVQSWADIKHRLAPDRRCYAYFHPQMPNEPLIFVWVALVKNMSDNVDELLDVDSPSQTPENADTAIFYSISNAQKGLAGVSFGNFLIKRVVDDVARDFKRIKTFATLSPLPGFHDWLQQQITTENETLLTTNEQRKLVTALNTAEADIDLAMALTDGWHERPELEEALKAPLQRLCTRYLLEAKRGAYAADRVAHFHLSNGARLERINWLADTSTKGLQQSAGMMINYLYKINDIERNHEAYTGEGKIIMSGSVRNLLKT